MAVYLPVLASSYSFLGPGTLSAAQGGNASAAPSRVVEGKGTPSSGGGSVVGMAAWGGSGGGYRSGFKSVYESLNEESRRQLDEVVREAKDVFER